VQHQPPAAATSDTRLLESTSGRHPEPQLSQAPAKAVQPMVPPGPVKPELPLATAAATLPPEPLLPPVPSPQVEASPRAEVAPAPEPEATLSFAPICVRDGSIAVGVVYDAVNVQWDEVTHQTAAATNGWSAAIVVKQTPERRVRIWVILPLDHSSEGKTEQQGAMDSEIVRAQESARVQAFSQELCHF